MFVSVSVSEHNLRFLKYVVLVSFFRLTISASAILLISIMENWEIREWGGLEWCNICIMLCKDR